MCPFCKDKPCNRHWCPYTQERENKMNDKKIAKVTFNSKTFYYDTNNKEEEKKAWIDGMRITPEFYEKIDKKTDKYMENFKKKYSRLSNIKLENNILEKQNDYVDLSDFE
jgi:hypothetical protein